MGAPRPEAEATGRKTLTKCHEIDFVKASDVAYGLLERECRDLDIRVLGTRILETPTPLTLTNISTVNNVGQSHKMPVYFIDTPKDEIDGILDVNIRAAINVTSMLLPSMVERSVNSPPFS